MIKATTIRCTCCNAELTAPQFYNGNPYGWTCITRVDPSYKRKKIKYIQCEQVKVLRGEGTSRKEMYIKPITGVAKRIVVYGNNPKDIYNQEGVYFVKETLLNK